MTQNTHLTMRLPSELVEKVDAVVKGGAFKSRSHAVRHAILAMLFEVGVGE